MVKPLILAVALVLLAQSALAMPCTLVSIRSEYWRHQESPRHYVLVWGEFSALRFKRHEATHDRSIWRAKFTGFAASARAFDRPFAAEVTIVDRLFTGLEGNKADPRRLATGLAGVTGLVFLERIGDRYSVETEFCTPILFTDPADVTPALACLAGRRCPRE